VTEAAVTGVVGVGEAAAAVTGVGEAAAEWRLG